MNTYGLDYEFYCKSLSKWILIIALGSALLSFLNSMFGRKWRRAVERMCCST